MKLAEYQLQMPDCRLVATNNILLDSEDTTCLTESNKIEILLFSLSTQETFGINVSAVKEVCRTMPITKTPNMPFGVAGIVSLRGDIMSVIKLAGFIGLDGNAQSAQDIMIVAEYGSHTLGLLVQSVDRIIHVDLDKAQQLNKMLAGNNSSITAITELPDGTLVSLLDVRQIFLNAFGEDGLDEVEAFPLDKIRGRKIPSPIITSSLQQL